jgi:hypothetical protein
MRACRFSSWRPVIAIVSLAVIRCYGSTIGAVTWGPSDSGLRLGITGDGTEKNAQLAVILENLGASMQVLLLEATGTVFQLQALGENGKRRRLSEDSPLFLVPNLQSHIAFEAKSEKLEPGATRKIIFPAEIIFLLGKEGGSKVTLDTILSRGNGLVAHFEVNETSLRMAHI